MFHKQCQKASDYDACMNVQKATDSGTNVNTWGNWTSYGSLQIRNTWKKMGFHWTAPALNASNQPIWISISCNSSQINMTDAAGGWGQWHSPTEPFEQELIAEICKL